MKRKFLVVQEVCDSEHSVRSYIRFAVAELEEAALSTIEIITLDEQAAQGIREAMRERAPHPKRVR